jgi:hypothetical protein
LFFIFDTFQVFTVQVFTWRIAIRELESPSMTRSSIELTIKIFVVLLVATFVWTLVRVYGMLA